MRSTCPRCLRPSAFCVCRGLVPVITTTRVVLLQHPREARLAICSAWLTRLALANCELHRGVRFESDGAVQQLASQPGAALLYPDGASIQATELAAPPPALFVMDGTWLQSEKMLTANPRLAALPRVRVAAAAVSGYRDLRREPAPHCLSTLEAVALALGELEGEPSRFEPMREAFRRMVDLQLACSQDGRRSPRHRRPAAEPHGRRGRQPLLRRSSQRTVKARPHTTAPSRPARA